VVVRDETAVGEDNVSVIGLPVGLVWKHEADAWPGFWTWASGLKLLDLSIRAWRLGAGNRASPNWLQLPDCRRATKRI